MRVWAALITISLCANAYATPPERAYDRTVDLIEQLYMYPDTITPSTLLQAASTHLARKIHWLIVEQQNEQTILSHGNGAALITVEVERYDELPHALLSIEKVLFESPYSLEDVDTRLELLTGLATGLDRYSRVLSGTKLESFDTRLRGTLVGIGATLKSTDESLVIVNTVRGGPADLSGIHAHDIIQRIDGYSTINMPLRQAIQRIQGERDTTLALEILRDGKLLTFSITRAIVVIPNVTHDILDEGIGYIKISHISQRTITNLKSILSSLRDLGGLSRGLVIDLRGNTGGSMKEAARSADEFLKQGMLLRTVGPKGVPIQNLQARMDATDSNTEPPIPIAILVNSQTASGAEILAGAMLEHERAVLVGGPTYGKGSVQKIFNLDEDTRLKLTVAEYFLANDRKINHIGITPDIHIGFIDLNEYGVRYHPNTDVHESKWLPIVREAEGWNGRHDSEDQDLALEIARRGLSAAAGSSRQEVLNALQLEKERESHKQRGHLLSAFEEKQINWSASAANDLPPDVSVSLSSTLSRDNSNELLITAKVKNNGDQPLGQTLLLLDSPDATMWEDIALPIGWIEPDQTAIGTALVPLRAGILARVDDVNTIVNVSNRPPLHLEHQPVIVQSQPVPIISVEAFLSVKPEQSGINIRIKNYSKNTLTNLATRFEYPKNIDLELLDRASTIRSLGVGQERQVFLNVSIIKDLPKSVPMTLIVETENFGTLAKWTLDLPTNGDSVKAIAPRITDATPDSHLPTGPQAITFAMTDDRSLDYAMVFVNGQKVAWHDRQDSAIGIQIVADIKPGQNIIVAMTKDDQGLQTRYQRVIKGEEPAAAAADAIETSSQIEMPLESP